MVPADLFAAEIKEINARLKRAAVADKKAENLRTSAGHMLLELRPKVEAAGLGWETWCEANIKRSYRDVQRCMALASSSDSEAAAEQARLACNKADRARRARDDTRVAPSDPAPVTAENPVIRSPRQSRRPPRRYRTRRTMTIGASRRRSPRSRKGWAPSKTRRSGRG